MLNRSETSLMFILITLVEHLYSQKNSYEQGRHPLGELKISGDK